MPRLSWQHIRFVEDQAPQDEGYRAYLKDMVMDFAERDPRNHNLIECAAAIVRTVSFYCQGEDGKAKFYVTEHVPVLTHRDWEIRSDSRESNRGARRRARPR